MKRMPALQIPLVEKVLWSLFLIDILGVLGGLSGLAYPATIKLVITYLPLFLLVIHACWTLGSKRGLTFISLAGFVGYAAEAISLNYFPLFGGSYTYAHGAGPTITKVPVSVIAYWAVFIYIGYWLMTTSLYWLSRKKPVKNHDPFKSVALLVVADGLVVTAIDLIMDPVSIRAGTWNWTNGGPYFGVPIGNFVGWFVITILVTGLFRAFEYYRPSAVPVRSGSAYLLPVLGYLLVGLDLILGAIYNHLSGLAIIGLIIVIGPPLANIGLYLRYRKVTSP